MVNLLGGCCTTQPFWESEGVSIETRHVRVRFCVFRLYMEGIRVYLDWKPFCCHWMCMVSV
jgi:hypothetical protein